MPTAVTATVPVRVRRGTHTYRDWRGHLVRHHHIDVTTLVEVPTEQGPFALPHVLRDADVRDVADLTAELRAVEADPCAPS